MNPKRIFLVDDHPLVREWLTTHLRQQGDLAVCGEAEDAPHALQGILALKPDVVILDISMSGRSGVELIKDLKRLQPNVGVIVLSMHDEMTYAERALRAGARGYVMKREATNKIVAAIRQVLAGNVYVSDRVQARLAEKFVGGMPPSSQSPVNLLSDRELEVFQLLGQGRDTKQIAEELQVNFKTVHTYCARIKEKLRLTKATELLYEAVRWEEQRQRM
ncbi:MAG: response regulator [Verrucomicrobiia bacterium]